MNIVLHHLDYFRSFSKQQRLDDPCVACVQALLAGLGKEKMSRCAKRVEGEMGRVRGQRRACTERPPTSIYTHLSKCGKIALKYHVNVTL